MASRLPLSFFQRDVLDVAPELPGKKIVRITEDKRREYMITEVEAYRGTEDLACHATKGRTPRTEIMFHEGGCIYMYFVYGMHWMLNIVAGPENSPQAVLIRGITGFNGPGKVCRELALDKSFYGEKLYESDRIWLEEGFIPANIITGPRIGVNYSGEYWSKVPWRFLI